VLADDDYHGDHPTTDGEVNNESKEADEISSPSGRRGIRITFASDSEDDEQEAVSEFDVYGDDDDDDDGDRYGIDLTRSYGFSSSIARATYGVRNDYGIGSRILLSSPSLTSEAELPRYPRPFQSLARPQRNRVTDEYRNMSVAMYEAYSKRAKEWAEANEQQRNIEMREIEEGKMQFARTLEIERRKLRTAEQNKVECENKLKGQLSDAETKNTISLTQLKEALAAYQGCESTTPVVNNELIKKAEKLINDCDGLLAELKRAMAQATMPKDREELLLHLSKILDVQECKKMRSSNLPPACN
jgi:hypothetical protein